MNAKLLKRDAVGAENVANRKETKNIYSRMNEYSSMQSKRIVFSALSNVKYDQTFLEIFRFGRRSNSQTLFCVPCCMSNEFCYEFLFVNLHVVKQYKRWKGDHTMTHTHTHTYCMHILLENKKIWRLVCRLSIYK